MLGLILLALPASAAQFADVTTSAGLADVDGYCFGAAWGDYNNDQFPDLYITAGGGNTTRTNGFYRNNGDSTFSRVGAAAGPITTDSQTSIGCAWVDFNNDAHLDLLVVNSWDTPARNSLYWNNGDGTFRSGFAGNLTQRAFVHSWPACADYNGDGNVDIYLAEGAASARSRCWVFWSAAWSPS